MQIHIYKIITCRRRNNVFFVALSVTAILMVNTSTHKCDFSGWTCGVDSNKNRTKTFTWPKRQLNTKIQCADIIWLMTFPCIGGRPKILVGCSNWYRQLALVDMDKPLSLWKKYLDFSLRSAGHVTQEFFRANLPLSKLYIRGLTLEKYSHYWTHCCQRHLWHGGFPVLTVEV